MNRIILIGNGFDIAHGLPTSYKEFVDYFWTKMKHLPILEPSLNKLFTLISKKLSTQNWLDIENEYYKILKGVKNERNNLYYDQLNELNSDFLEIEKLLQEYLLKITKYQRNLPISTTFQIKENIYQTIDPRDIGQSYSDKYREEIKNKINSLKEKPNWQTDYHTKHYIEPSIIINADNFIIEYDVAKDKDNFIQGKIKEKGIPELFTTPTDTLFLNFNYTKTVEQHIYPESNFEVINIHGELDNPNNPMIFGYGDELDDDYKTLENENDNELLKNMKSIRYLETDNYRRLLSFIESEPYQVLVMGHSCGNSDRTLLNTLFEHENCVSIKPYCFINKEGKDNYSEIVRNISRNFKDKQSMRDKVVNKTFCTTLAQGDLT